MPGANYLELEDILVTRWKEQVAGLKTVVGVPDITVATMRRVVRTSPTGVLFWNGDEIPTGQGNETQRGASQLVRQRWMFLIAVKNVSDVNGGSGAREEAGPLMRKTIHAFAGWKPDIPGYKEMFRISQPGATELDNIAFFPVQFSIEFFEGTQNV